MARKTSGTRGDVRQSALWGSGNRGGEFRTNALWGKGGKGTIVLLVMLVLPLFSVAASARSNGTSSAPTYVEPGLLERAQANPTQMFNVIVQSTQGARSAEDSFETVEKADEEALKDEADEAELAEKQANEQASKLKRQADRDRARAERAKWKAQKELLKGLRNTLRGDLDERFDFIKGVTLEIAGRRLVRLAQRPGLTITEDVPVKLSSTTDAHIWPAASGILPLLGTNWKAAPNAPAIAIVDSGIQRNRADFADGARIAAHQVITRLNGNSNEDGRGHGTFVASIAAGSAPGRLGASPTSPIIDVDVMDDSGQALTSDVIAGAEWIYQHKDELNIRVANFSLHSARPSNFTKDPLNKAVEKLWFGGVVVVAAAGNYGTPNGPSGVKFAPGNDPFVITVGALDLDGSLRVSKHDVPTWSAYGRTYDGFMKPDIAAAGRYMVGAIPSSSTLASEKPANITSPGYMRLSGTSFSAPVVAGAAAQILARHPNWTPDQVKGALMMTARRLTDDEVPPGSAGVGEVNAWRASMVTNPSNPNQALNRFLASDSATGGTVFDAVSWADAARESVSWDSVSWADVSWTDVSWADVSWSDVSWADVSWADVLAVADVSWEDAAGNETEPTGGDYIMTPQVDEELATDPELNPDAVVPPADDPDDVVTEAPATGGAPGVAPLPAPLP